MQHIDIDSWNRKEQFHYFFAWDNPFFNICADAEVTELWALTKETDTSFFAASFYLLLKALNDVEAFRLRIRGDAVILHDRIHGGCTVLTEEKTFVFADFPYVDDFETFQQATAQTIQRARAGIPLTPHLDQDDRIHGSVLPWISFRSVEHAKRLRRGDSVPKLTWGKVFSSENRMLMPVSVAAHHSLVDGLHVAELLQRFEEYCRTCAQWIR